MIGKWIRKTTGILWLKSPMRVMFALTVCLLIGGLAPAGAAAQTVGATSSTIPVTQPATYRYAGRPDGTTQVQRSQDGGLTWPAAGMIPDAVAQLAVNPANDTLLFARTGTSLWHSANSAVTWVRVDNLPDRPLALAFAGSSEPSGLVFAGTATHGLYSSLDGGTTWQAAGGSLTPVGAGDLAVTALAINPGDLHVVYAASTFTMSTPEGQHSVQSVFISVDDGRRWFEMTPAPRFAQTIVQLMPLTGPSLAVSIVSAFGSPLVMLEVSPALISGLDSVDAGTRAASARALGLSHDRSLLPVLINHLRDPDLLAGDQVARAIGRLGDPAAVPLLMPVLSDAGEAIRASAATALGLLQAKEAIPQLATMLQSDGPLARRAAAEALATIGTPEAIAALTRPLQDAGMTPVRFAAMNGLQLAGQSAILPLGVALSSDNDPAMRRNAAEMLGWLSAADAVPTLVRSLSDPDAAVRTQATWALGEMHTAPAELALSQVSAAAPASPILHTAGTTTGATISSADPNRQNEAPLVAAALPGSLAQALLNRWILGALATVLALSTLGATVILLWTGPRQHLKPS